MFIVAKDIYFIIMFKLNYFEFDKTNFDHFDYPSLCIKCRFT